MNQDASKSSGSDLPREVRGWNWGAFFLNWVWGLGNGTWIGLLMFVPLVNLVVPFVLGAQGNRWAWENRRWSSVEQFKRVQKTWGWLGLGVWLTLGGWLVGGHYLERLSLRKAAVYEQSLGHLDRSAKVASTVGRPIEASVPTGRILDSGSLGWASINFQVSGPRGSGLVVLDGRKREGEWFLETLELQVDQTGERIDLLRAPVGSNRAP